VRLQRWPHAMLASTTHDTKRSEDVRARINVLSEIPEEWRAALLRWTRINMARKSIVQGELAPDPNDEYLFYQVLLGAWPFDPTPEEFANFRDRLVAYMLKAIKEAEVHTSWVNANAEYEAAVGDVVTQVVTDDPHSQFRQDVGPLQRRVAFYGLVNSLSQTLVKLTAPGVPDIYQGQELWDFSLVDPDNRRPVDYDRRRKLLAELRERADAPGADLPALARELVANSTDGRIKLYVTWRTLQYRAAQSELFDSGSYRPLRTIGRRRKHVCAFVRARNGTALVTAVPRLLVRLTNGSEVWPLGKPVWRDTWLVLPREPAGRRYRHLFTGAELEVREADGIAGFPLAEVFRDFPVALLERLG
jgi:(1->4)-alpha-D-glucan 1-alpha-D-glucosylmutase